MLECPKTAQMKDFLKLFKTIMDFKGLSFIVTEQPFNKKLRPVFYFATVICQTMNLTIKRFCMHGLDLNMYLHEKSHWPEISRFATIHF